MQALAPLLLLILSCFLPFLLAQPDVTLSPRWVRDIGTAGTETGASACIRSDGVYYTGIASGSNGLNGQRTIGGIRDAFLMKLSYGGVVNWTVQFGSTGSEYPQALACSDRTDSLIVVGYTDSAFNGQTKINPANSDLDGFISSYSLNGTHRWTRQIGSIDDDILRSVTIDSNGNSYILGHSLYSATICNRTSGNNGGTDVFLIKYSPDGYVIWCEMYGTTGNDNGFSVAISNTEDLLVIGGSTNSNGVFGTGYTGTLAGYYALISPVNGSLIFSQLITSNQKVEINAVAFSGPGDTDLGTSIYVAGYFTANVTGYPVLVAQNDGLLGKYDLGGRLLWGTSIGGVFNEAVNSMFIDPSDSSIFVCGTTQSRPTLPGYGSSAGAQDGFIGRYLPNGTLSGGKLLGTSSNDALSGIVSNMSSNLMFSIGNSVASNFAGFPVSNLGLFDIIIVGVQVFTCPIGSICSPVAPFTPTTCRLGSLCNSTNLFTDAEPDCPRSFYCPNVTSAIACSGCSAPACNTTRLTAQPVVLCPPASSSSLSFSSTGAGSSSLLSSLSSSISAFSSSGRSSSLSSSGTSSSSASRSSSSTAGSMVTSSSTSSGSGGPGSPQASSSADNGATIGGAVGGSLGFLIILLIVILCLKSRNSSSSGSTARAEFSSVASSSSTPGQVELQVK